MPFKTHYITNPGHFETQLTERTDAFEIIEFDKAILASPYWRGGQPRLVEVDYNVDLGEIDMAVLAENILPHLEATQSLRTRRERIAWVVPNDLSRSIISVWELMPGKDYMQDFKSFTTTEEALAWLHKPSDDN